MSKVWKLWLMVIITMFSASILFMYLTHPSIWQNEPYVAAGELAAILSLASTTLYKLGKKKW